MNRELRALTSVRGIAAWLVVLFHIRWSIADLPPDWETMMAKGHFAVDFFFLLSGFVIWLTWAERLRQGETSAGIFLLRRIARIWPLHACIMAGGIGLVLMLTVTGRQDQRFPWTELPFQLLLMQSWLFRKLSWNVPTWSISAEMGAYCAFPLLARYVDWRQLPAWAAIGIIAALTLTLHGVIGIAGQDLLGTDIPRYGLLCCLLEFTAGTIVCELWRRWRISWRVSTIGAALLAIVLLLSPLPDTLRILPAFAAALLALALTSNKAGNPLEMRWLHYLGEISYATYLSHFLLWFAFKLVFVQNSYATFPPGTTVPLEQIPVYLALVLGASIALHHGVERPAQRWLNGRISRLHRPHPAR